MKLGGKAKASEFVDALIAEGEQVAPESASLAPAVRGGRKAKATSPTVSVPVTTADSNVTGSSFSFCRRQQRQLQLVPSPPWLLRKGVCVCACVWRVMWAYTAPAHRPQLCSCQCSSSLPTRLTFSFQILLPPPFFVSFCFLLTLLASMLRLMRK